MEIRNQVSLKQYNTFGLSAIAEKFISFTDEGELLDFCPFISGELLILGGGSNMLLVDDTIPFVLKNDIQGISVIKEYDDHVMVEAGAGVVWHDLVLWTIDENYGGIENLALIPGNCGAAPIQNIGAYGVELKDVFHSLWCVHLETASLLSFHNNECKFGYRDSVFKNDLKGKVIITKVILKLSKEGHHKINTSYGAISNVLSDQNIADPSIMQIAEAVIDIRSSKLPDPAKIGNSGSFFKNPLVEQAVYDRILKNHPSAPGYPSKEGFVKLAAGWLIDQCGWKGKVVGNTGCYKNQALVLVNHGDATGEEIMKFALKVQDSVEQKFGVKLVPEVNLIGAGSNY